MADFENNTYCDKTLSELKEILRVRKLKVAGKKKDLVERLIFDDRNSRKNEPAPEFHMCLPAMTDYTDVHADHLQNFPHVTEQRVLDFLQLSDQKLNEKIELLYAQRYLRYVRIAINDTTYITSNVWAEMKKSTSYKVDISIDRNAVIQQTQCECAVGQGPSAHCKHVRCVLFGLVNYCTSGSILTEVTCTQVLQRFHRSKPMKGSPLRTKNLSGVRGNVRPSIYDPRPGRLINSLKNEQNMRNMVLNRQGKSKWPVLQLYESANIRALAADHAYMELTMEDHFLRTEKVSCISKAEIYEIEQQTKSQSACDRWTVERCKRITSSNFGNICKVTIKRDIDMLLRGLLQPVNLKTKQTMYGRQYESVAVESFESLTNTTTKSCGLFVSETHPMLAASPDRVIDGETLVEVKCPYSARNQLISELTVPYLMLTDGKLTLKKTHNYYYQIQGQLFCAGRRQCKFIVFSLTDLKIMDISFDHEFVMEMLNRLSSFYNLHFKNAILNKYLFNK
ncbi:hypothetical protein SNE40_013138 [Patella caerulea]|uniref:SWIM-type domain-containing protein n=1 Tax=Patella caerulea TaxID=87958 RepID=A0AAN8JNT1_PATCE